MKVLILGGAGYIGSELTKELNKDKNITEIIIYDNLSAEKYNLFTNSKLISEKVRFVKGDILDSRLLNKTLKNVDLVYHLATIKKEEAQHHYMEQVNNWGTSEVVNLIEKNTIKKLIFLSTTDILDEKNTVNPQTAYAWSMHRAEQHIKRLVEEERALIIRSSEIFGNGISLNLKSSLNKIVFDSYFCKRFNVVGDGTNTLQLVGIQNIVNVLSNFAQTSNGIFTINDYSIEVNELCEEIMRLDEDAEMIFVSHHYAPLSFEYKSDFVVPKSFQTVLKEFYHSIN